jgi:hypothetical protein
MVLHKKVKSFFSKEAREKRRMEGSEKETQQFVRESQKIARETALEERRATLRTAQQKARPKGFSSGGVGLGGSFRSFAQDFAGRQQPVAYAPTKRKARKRRKARQQSQSYFGRF